MLCKVCREDLDAARFHAAEYRNARVRCSIPTCIGCSPLSKKERRTRTQTVLSVMAGGDKAAKKAWRRLPKEQKKQSQMERRTPSEMALDSAMKTAGLKFAVQAPIGCYWADFYLFDSGVVVEVDGSIHDTPTQKEYDARRNAWMSAQGYTVLRFQNRQVKEELEQVLTLIMSTSAKWKNKGRKCRKGVCYSPTVKPARDQIFDNPVYVPPVAKSKDAERRALWESQC